MAHFAKVHNGIVEQVIVADAEFFDTYIDNSPGEWVQTSYNTRGGKHYAPNSDTEDSGTPLRKNYASIGGSYDGVGFYSPPPHASWTLNKTTYLWEPPITDPGGDTYWDEDAYQADNTKGWTNY